MSPSLIKILQLSQIPGFGLASYWKLIEGYGDVCTLLSQPLETLQQHLKPKLAESIFRVANNTSYDEKLTRTLDWCEKNNVSIICHEDDEYPILLKETHRGPPLLFVKGQLQSLYQRQIAIVGSRSSSTVGKNNAVAFARGLAEMGFAITSGLALGIDACAHRGALEASAPTIAVIGCGIDRIYPQRNGRLAEEIIAAGGAIISEFPIGTPPVPHNFPRRNRIISGLSLGTLVIEAALKSGSLITAKIAAEQNREVFALPGSIHNAKSRGCNALIKDGAHLVESPEDIVFALSGDKYPASNQNKSNNLSNSYTDQEARVLSCVEFDPTSIEIIAEKSNVNVGELLAVLLELELKQAVVQSSGGYMRTA